MNRRTFAAAGAAAFAAAGLGPAAALVPKPSLRERLTTRSETSGYRQTSSLADVETFLGELDRRGAPIFRGSLGTTKEGRDIPFVVASRPRVTTPEEAVALDRPIVYMQATLHGYDGAGKEATLAVLRDLLLSTEKTLLEDVVLVVVPVANPDGNERLGPVARNAPFLEGPATVGTRENGQGLDLDLDWVKAEAPETRAVLRFLERWKPHVFVDFRTSAGSFDAYALTYAPSLHPAAYYGGAYARDRMLPALHDDLHAKYGIDSFDYGHFGRTRALPVPPPASNRYDYGWFTRPPSPRYAVNYVGLAGPVAVLAAAYSHDPLERRIYTTRACMESILSYCSDNDDDVMAVSQTASHWLGGRVPLRGVTPAKPPTATLQWDRLTGATPSEAVPGVPEGFAVSDSRASAAMPAVVRYAAATVIDQPRAYLIPYEHARYVLPLLRSHGVPYDTEITARKLTVQRYTIATVDRDAQPTQGHRLVRLGGRWEAPVPFATRFGAVFVRTAQTAGPLLSQLLEPESDDGFIAWNAFDAVLAAGAYAPVYRVV